MIIFLILSSIFFLFYFKYHKETGIGPLLIFFLSFFLLFLFVFEYAMTRIDFFISDELYYINFESGKAVQDNSRLLWLQINEWILNDDISLDKFVLKIINIPIAAGLLLLLWFMYDKNRKIFLLVLILPYLPFLATKNLRDIAILFVAALAISSFHSQKPLHVLISMFSLVALFFLRPFAAFFIIVIFLAQLAYLFVKYVTELKVQKVFAKKIFLLLLVLLILLPGALVTVESRITQYFDQFIYATGEGLDARTEGRVGSNEFYNSGNTGRDFIIASVRYVFTPMPFSFFLRVLYGERTEWGLLDDIVRLLNQVMYYILLCYILINARFIWDAFRQISLSGKTFICYLLTYWPIYSFYLYGVSHQRLKLPFQIAIFLLSLAIYEQKRRSQLKHEKIRADFKFKKEVMI